MNFYTHYTDGECVNIEIVLKIRLIVFLFLALRYFFQKNGIWH